MNKKIFEQGEELPSIPIAIRKDGGDYKTLSDEIFKGRRVLLIGCVGAFRNTDTEMLKAYDERWFELTALDQAFDDVFYTSVNDHFVMDAWHESMGLQNIKPIPDGNGYLGSHLGLLFDMHPHSLAFRNRRYVIILNDNRVEKLYIEPEPTMSNGDPYYKTMVSVIVTDIVDRHFEETKGAK